MKLRRSLCLLLLAATLPALRAEPAVAEAEKRWGRAVFGNLAFLGGLAVNYWIGAEYNRIDWDFKLSWADQSRRVFDLRNLRFDTNAFEVNALHGAQGAVSHLLSRGNGLGPGEAILLGLASSAAWEYVAEFREMVSLNDMVITPAAGFVLGESLFEFGRYLRRPGSGPIRRTFGNFIDPVGWLDRLLGGGSGTAEAAEWRSGGIGAWISAGVLDASADGKLMPEVRFGFSGRIEGFRLAGARPLPGSAFDAEIGLFRGGISSADIISRVRFAESGRPASSGPPERGFRIGLASGVDFHGEGRESGGDEFIAVDLLGLTACWMGESRGLSFRLGAELYGGFSGVRPAALAEYRRRGDNLFYAKSTLRYWEYYFALGPSLILEAEAAGRGWTVSARLRHHRFDSIDGLDRFQASVLRDFDLEDKRTLWSVRLSLPLCGRPSALFAAAEGRVRWGRMAGVEDRSRRLGFQAGVSFGL